MVDVAIVDMASVNAVGVAVMDPVPVTMGTSVRVMSVVE